MTPSTKPKQDVKPNKKMSVAEMFGPSNSVAVSDFDCRNVGGGEFYSFEDEGQSSPEEM